MIDTNSVEICYTFIYCLSFIHLFCKFIIKSIIFNSEFAHFLYSDGQKIGGKKKKKKKKIIIIIIKINDFNVVINVKKKIKKKEEEEEENSMLLLSYLMLNKS